MKVNAEPMNTNLWTRWFKVGVFFIAVGAVVMIYRFIFGIGAVSNLSDGSPWGLWIAFDVVIGIALAAGGFTTAALVYIFNKGKYSPLVRPAVLTAMLGYGLAGFSIVLDVGRWWQVYNPVLPGNWQGNSAMFEVAICVMLYLSILIIEFIPVATERWKKNDKGFLKKISVFIEPLLNKVILLFIILGVVVSTLHQSSLGSLMLLAKYKLHPLWFTPWLPLMFLISAIAVGFPVVVVESTISSRTFKTKPENHLLKGLLKFTPWVLGLYLILRIWDVIYYGKISMLLSTMGLLYIVELSLFAIIPLILLNLKSYKENPGKMMN
ncbi:MAG: Ni/Fe-hydrogenase cytochrome b subunit, partial [Candidatus Aminicenantes bacterium]|nr:Ni/Fe-hydrogenase cytochrome b subunit [Candidatus Aminicenantes bacterium]